MAIRENKFIGSTIAARGILRIWYNDNNKERYLLWNVAKWSSMPTLHTLTRRGKLKGFDEKSQRQIVELCKAIYL